MIKLQKEYCAILKNLYLAKVLVAIDSTSKLKIFYSLILLYLSSCVLLAGIPVNVCCIHPLCCCYRPLFLKLIY